MSHVLPSSLYFLFLSFLFHSLFLRLSPSFLAPPPVCLSVFSSRASSFHCSQDRTLQTCAVGSCAPATVSLLFTGSRFPTWGWAGPALCSPLLVLGEIGWVCVEALDSPGPEEAPQNVILAIFIAVICTALIVICFSIIVLPVS